MSTAQTKQFILFADSTKGVFDYLMDCSIKLNENQFEETMAGFIEDVSNIKLGHVLNGLFESILRSFLDEIDWLEVRKHYRMKWIDQQYAMLADYIYIEYPKNEPDFIWHLEDILQKFILAFEAEQAIKKVVNTLEQSS